MIRIRLKRKYLYTAQSDGKSYYRYTYLDIGYKGRGNIGQKWFLCIYEEDYCETLLGADIIWHSIF